MYGGAIREAGVVSGKTGARQTASDWMSLEQQRGISISSAAIQLAYQDYVLNLLDTPGHQDFSEDTYRTLMAADSAVMLLDAARGVQPQTEKLFDVCRRRNIPIVTFINKLDRPARDPLDLLNEVEQVLELAVTPVTWPIGDGPDFRGIYDRITRQVHPYERGHRDKAGSAIQTAGVADPLLTTLLGSKQHARLRDEIDLVESLLPPLDSSAFLAGRLTPVFFGSVLAGSGVEVFLRHFLSLAPGPGPLLSVRGAVAPECEIFSAFVFKLQANMNPLHRDRTAFARVATGRFERGMHAYLTRTGRTVKLARAHTMFGRERVTVEEAWPGDVVGLVVPGTLHIGDVLSSDPSLHIPNFPRFAPEAFATVRVLHADQSKPFRKGLTELAEEGVVQVFMPGQGSRDPILGAVGPLQFDVFKHRMLEEYGVEVTTTKEPHTQIRWLEGEPTPTTRFVKLARDLDGQPVGLFKNEREINYFEKANPDVAVVNLPQESEIVRL